MSTYQSNIFHLPSFLFADDNMSPTEYCQSLTFLEDRAPPKSKAFDDWRGSPWYPNRHAPRRPAFARDLLYGSTPDFDFNWSLPPRNKYVFTGTGHPKPGRPAPRKPKPKTIGEEFASIGQDFDSTDETHFKLANSRLTRPKVSKFANLFSELIFPHGVRKNIWTVTVADFSSMQRKRNTTRSKSPGLEPHGDMSNLRPHDQDMDAATCDKSPEKSETPESCNPLASKETANTYTSPSKKVTFDPGAESATQSTAEQRAECKARAGQMAKEERLASTREEVDQQIAKLDLIWPKLVQIMELAAKCRDQTTGKETLVSTNELGEEVSRLAETYHDLIIFYHTMKTCLSTEAPEMDEDDEDREITSSGLENEKS